MTSPSPWKLDHESHAFPRLERTLEVDVAIIGGGITGVMTAYELIKAGKKVALLEQDRIAGGATGWTTAMVTQVTDASLAELRETFGAEAASLVWKNGKQAIDELERIVESEKIECEFMRCPAYIFAMNDADVARLHREEELANEAGFKAKMDDAPLGFSTPGYLRVPDQAKFHPVKFLTALAKRVEELGGLVFEESKALSYSGSSPCRVKTEHGEILAKSVVLATYMPNGDPESISVRMAAYQTYVLEAMLPSGTLPEAIFWDTEKPYHYFRVDKLQAHDRLMLGGEDHLTGQASDPRQHEERLREFLKSLLPEVKTEIVRTWSGEILEPIDGLPFIGKVHTHQNCYMATGFSGNGMTFGILSALINRDLILGKETLETKLYGTLRLTGFWNLMGRGLNFVTQWIKGRTQSDTSLMKNIKPDEGAIVELKGKKVAVYKDAQGKILKLSPLCTHLKCTVCWNPSGKTWDCPCHGSRFKKDGEVLNGPASKPLKKID